MIPKTFEAWWAGDISNTHASYETKYAAKDAWNAGSQAMRDLCIAVCREEASCRDGDMSYVCLFCADVMADVEAE